MHVPNNVSNARGVFMVSELKSKSIGRNSSTLHCVLRQDTFLSVPLLYQVRV